MAKRKKIIPHFIEERGCINCEVSKKSQEKYGSPYVFDHELMAGCLLFGCTKYNYSVSNPFLDPEEAINKAKKTENNNYIENAKKYCRRIKEKFGVFFEQIGVSLDKIIE